MDCLDDKQIKLFAFAIKAIKIVLSNGNRAKKEK